MKPFKFLSLALLVTGVLASLWGCSTSNAPYRTYIGDPKDPPQRPDPSQAKLLPIDTNLNACVEDHGTFKMGFTEFDDQGWFWSHQQWKTVKDEIEQEHRKADKEADGLTIVVFVHGWQNNAAYGNGNVAMFRGVLTNLSAIVKPRRVFGVYLGWRGQSLTGWGLQELSFYHRKDVAERIGHQGSATQVFTELEKMQDTYNAEHTNSQSQIPRTELIVVGHSFGGQLVFSAISQILTERLVLAKHENDLNSFGDLVILVNPAFEASLYKNLQSLATSDDIDYPQNQRPVMAIFTSKGDDATGCWFPLGRNLSSWYEMARPGGLKTNEIWMFSKKKAPDQDEYAAIRQTVGHDKEFINYQLVYTNWDRKRPALTQPTSRHASGEEVARGIERAQSALTDNNNATNPAQLKPYVFTYSTNVITGMTTSTNYYQCILMPITNVLSTIINSSNTVYILTNGIPYKRANPFLNVEVDAKIIKDHNDINNPIFLEFLRDFILFSETNFPSEIAHDGNRNSK